MEIAFVYVNPAQCTDAQLLTMLYRCLKWKHMHRIPWAQDDVSMRIVQLTVELQVRQGKRSGVGL
jgi:hypothetical protein